MRIRIALLTLCIICLHIANFTVNAQCPDIICKTLNITAINSNNDISYGFEIKNVGTDTLFLNKAVIQNYVSMDSSKNGLSAAGGSFVDYNSKKYLLPGETYTGQYGAYTSVSIVNYPYLVSNFYYTGHPECSTANNYFIKKIVLTPPVVAQFATNVTTGIAPLTVQFTDQSTGTPTSWSWDFNNDGKADTSVQNVSFTYKTPGTYAVKFKTSKVGFIDSITKTNYIIVGSPVDAQFTADVTTGTAPLTVKFTDQSTGTPTAWSWDFTNDGTVDATSQHPSFTYQTAGTYAVKLVASKTGSTNTIIKTTYITVNKASTTGIEKTKDEIWLVYPNPSNGKVILDFGEKFRHQKVAIEIYDQSGRLVFSSKLENQTRFEHDFTSYIPGIFTIKVMANNEVFLKKVVVQ